jgi:hypothetical protein
MERREYRRRTVDADAVHDDGVVDEQEVRVVSEPAHTDAVAERESVTAFYDSWPARINTILWTLLLALEGLLALRFALLAFGANASSGFVDFVYDVSWPFVRPFDGAFANRTWDEGIIEVSTLLAMGVWLLVFGLIIMVINALLPKLYEGGTVTRRRHVSHL